MDITWNIGCPDAVLYLSRNSRMLFNTTESNIELLSVIDFDWMPQFYPKTN